MNTVEKAAHSPDTGYQDGRKSFADGGRVIHRAGDNSAAAGRKDADP